MKTLPKTIRTQVNQMAHRQASRYAMEIRDTVLQELQRLVKGGMNVVELAAALECMEALAPAQSVVCTEKK